MAKSSAKGAVRSGVLPAARIRIAAHANLARRVAFESFGVPVLADNRAVLEDADVIVFSVKPQIVKDVVLQLRPVITAKKLLVSVAAGIKLKDLQGIADLLGLCQIHLLLWARQHQVLGAASMATKSDKHLGELKDDVTSAGGTTIAGIHELEKGGFSGILMNAVVAAAKHSQG